MPKSATIYYMVVYNPRLEEFTERRIEFPADEGGRAMACEKEARWKEAALAQGCVFGVWTPEDWHRERSRPDVYRPYLLKQYERSLLARGN